MMHHLCQAIGAAYKSSQAESSQQEHDESTPPDLRTLRLFYRADLFDMGELWTGKCGIWWIFLCLSKICDTVLLNQWSVG